MAEAAHMAIVEELSRRCLNLSRVMPTIFAAKTIRPVSLAKKSNAPEKSEIMKQRTGDLSADHRIAYSDHGAVAKSSNSPSV
jgi:hypothetical protein